MRKKLLYAAAPIVALAVGLAAHAQIVRQVVQSVNLNDVIIDIVHAVPTAQSMGATLAQVSGAFGYKNGGVASTAWSYQFTKGQQYYYIKPSGTLATGTLTTEVNPGAGQLECFFSTRTQSGISWTAGSAAQTLHASVPTAGVANVLQCLIFDSANQTWYRIK